MSKNWLPLLSVIKHDMHMCTQQHSYPAWFCPMLLISVINKFREWLASVIHFVEEDCKPRSFRSLIKTINAQKRFARATAISDEFDDLITNMQVRLLILAQ